MLVWASSAVASRGHEFTRTFAEPCIAEPCIGGTLKKPNGVAVNEATGDVYVVDEGANRVVRFDKEGAFLSEFNGSGLLPGEEHVAGSLGRPGEIETGRFEKPETIAVDNSCALLKLSEPECKAQDPSNGDVYVVDAEHRVIDKYTAAGEYVGQIVEPESFPLDGVAADPHGGVWVFQEAKIITQFTNTTPNEFVGPKKELPGIGDFGLPGFAVDSHGDLYVRHGLQQAGQVLRSRIAKYTSSATLLSAELDGEESSGIATDQTNDNAVVDNITTLAVFDANGSLLERLGEENGEKHLSEGAGVAVAASAGSVYVADAAAAEVVVFGPQEPSAPTIFGESFSSVGSDNATLEAEINPRSESTEAATEYHFAYGACPSLAQCAQSGYEAVAPVPDAQAEPDFEIHTATVTVRGLKPATAYHFKVIAHNARGTVEGEELLFTTERSGGPFALPDNRGWELVSPPDKRGANVEPISEFGVIQAAVSGDGITYLANAPTETQPQGSANQIQILSRRSGAAWGSRDIAIPHSSATGFAVGPGPEYKFFDPELTLSAVQPFGEFIPQLSAEASESTAYLHRLDETCGSACYRPLVTGKLGFANVPEGTQFGEEEECTPHIPEGGSASARVACGPEFVGATEDLSHVVLSSLVSLTPSGPSPGLYEWAGGALSPINLLPQAEGGGAAGGSGLGLVNSEAARHAISADGSLIVWSTASGLYLRDMSSEETIRLDEPEAGCEVECASGNGAFQIASVDGSRMFFTSTHRLTEDSGANAEEREADLYECRIALVPKLSCKLSDLTPKNGAEGANVLGKLLGASEDGTQLYFVAEGVLSEAANDSGESAQAGEPNLYIRNGGATEFIATLSSGDETVWALLAGTTKSLSAQPTRVSPSGRYLAFMSQARLTTYDNRDAATGRPTAEVYSFDATSGRLVCASCDPTGARPHGVEYHQLEPGSGGKVGGPRDIWPTTALVAANVPGWTAIGSGQSTKNRYQPRYLGNGGRLFFNTVNQLVPQDSNGTQDVYEYEPPGIGGCSESSETFSVRSGGCAALISSGASPQESAFLDASESGDDVFFLTQARLSKIDIDNSFDVYDAHVCTSEPCITYEEAEPSNCPSESACKAPIGPQPSIFGAPPSATFTGPGNLAPVPPPSAHRKTVEELRIEKLKKALKTCRAKKGKKRRACERAARKRYAKPGSKHKSKAKAKQGKKKQ